MRGSVAPTDDGRKRLYEAIPEPEKKQTITDKPQPKVVKITSNMKSKPLKLQISDLEYIKLTPSAQLIESPPKKKIELQETPLE